MPPHRPLHLSMNDDRHRPSEVIHLCGLRKRLFGVTPNSQIIRKSVFVNRTVGGGAFWTSPEFAAALNRPYCLSMTRHWRCYNLSTRRPNDLLQLPPLPHVSPPLSGGKKRAPVLCSGVSCDPGKASANMSG